MATRAPFGVGEWYHCYNRGVDKRRTFSSSKDYERLLLLIYTANGEKSVHLSNLRDRKLDTVLSDARIERGDPLVDIGAFVLMPNHIHIILKEIRGGGIALFMQKVFTGYTMYFNKKYTRTGALFSGTFKSKHIADDIYLKQVVSYVHLNPADLFDPDWKDASGATSKLETQLLEYPYSSLPEFSGKKPRPHRYLLGNAIFETFDKVPTITQMIRGARTYQTLSF